MGVRIELVDDVAVITMDWPENRNALTEARITEVVTALADARDGAARCIVLTGNGAFCAGADLGAVQDGGAEDEERRTTVESVAQSIVKTLVFDCPIPVLAAVDGPAVGMGLDIALACDDRLIGPDGWLLQGWGRLGLLPGTGGELLLRRLNPSLLWRLLAEQPRIGPEEAERLGLGTAVAGRSALEAAVARARQLALLPRATLSVYVELSRASLRQELPDHLARCAALQGSLLGDPELVARAAALRRG
ncbi:MAG: Enoyl-CoA hydratase / carnithine racemase [Acidimicrobiales bacterium]|nr:Enoyl-CoA hydratase / carnithine racemase [Acidimicrobiales bacterium]